MNLFELFVKIGVDDQASGTIAKVTKGLGKGLVTAAKVSTAAITAVGGAITALGGIGLNYNKQMETYTSNFKVMLGDMESATRKVEELKEFAAKTPFEMSDLASATQTLLAFGIESEKTSDIMKMLGDVSLGNSEKFQSLALVFGQVSSQGKLMGQDLLQMINAGFNPLQVISERTGESVESLKEKMSKGQIGIEEVTQAFQWATEEGGKFFNGMDEGSKTLEGRISTLKDNAVALLGEVFLPISETLSNKIVPAAIDAVDDLSNAFKEGGTEGLIEAGGAMVGNLVSGLTNKLPKLIQSASDLIISFINSIAKNKKRIVSGAVEMVSTLADGILSLIPQLAEVSIDILMGLVDGIIQNLPMLRDAAVSVVEKLAGMLSDPQFLTDLIDAAIEIIYQLSLGLVNNESALLNAAIKIITTLVEYILKPENIYKIIAMALNLVIAIGEGLIEAAGELVIAAAKLVGTLVDSMFNTDWEKVGGDIVSYIWDGLKDAWENLTHWFSEAWGEFKAWIKGEVYETGGGALMGARSFGVKPNVTVDLKPEDLKTTPGYIGFINKSADVIKKLSKKTAEEIEENAELTAEELEEIEKKRLERQKNLREEFLDYVVSTTEEMVDIEEEYLNKLDERTQKIKNSFDIFEEYQEAEKKSGMDMLKNIYAQNNAIAQFYANIEKLEARGASTSLVEEFLSRGVSSAAELSALLGMSDYQLQRYFQGYADREQIASKYANMQLSEEKQELQNQLATMFDSISGVYDENAEELGISFIDKFVQSIKDGTANIATALRDTVSTAISQAMGTMPLLKTATAGGSFAGSLASAMLGAIKGDNGNSGLGIYLNGDLLVGGISDSINNSLGQNYSIDERGVVA